MFPTIVVWKPIKAVPCVSLMFVVIFRRPTLAGRDSKNSYSDDIFPYLFFDCKIFAVASLKFVPKIFKQLFF